MVLVVILEPGEQLFHDRQPIGTCIERHIIALEVFHERLRQAVALRALDRSPAGEVLDLLEKE